MPADQLIAVVAITVFASAVALAANWASGFRRTLQADAPIPDPSALRSPKPPRGYSDQLPTLCQRHVWLIATREETAGRPRAIYRCQDCGAVEVREVP